MQVVKKLPVIWYNNHTYKLQFHIKVNIKNTPKKLEILSNVLGVFKS